MKEKEVDISNQQCGSFSQVAGLATVWLEQLDWSVTVFKPTVLLMSCKNKELQNIILYRLFLKKKIQPHLRFLNNLMV